MRRQRDRPPGLRARARPPAPTRPPPAPTQLAAAAGTATADVAAHAAPAISMTTSRDGSVTDDDLAAARTVARGLEKNQRVGDGGADQRDEVRAGATAATPARQRCRRAP